MIRYADGKTKIKKNPQAFPPPAQTSYDESSVFPQPSSLIVL